MVPQKRASIPPKRTVVLVARVTFHTIAVSSCCSIKSIIKMLARSLFGSLVALASIRDGFSFAPSGARTWGKMAPAPQHGRVQAGLASAAVPDAPATMAAAPAAAVTCEHKFMSVPPVRALMLSTAWKNDAENLRALG